MANAGLKQAAWSLQCVTSLQNGTHSNANEEIGQLDHCCNNGGKTLTLPILQ